MIAAQLLTDAFADVLAELGESITLHASTGDESVDGLLTLDSMSIGFSDGEPIGQTVGTLSRRRNTSSGTSGAAFGWHSTN